MNLRQILPDQIPGFISDPASDDLLLQGVNTLGGRLTVADVIHLCLSGHMQLWVGEDKSGPVIVFLSEVVSFPRARELRLFGLAGEDLKGLSSNLPVLKAFAASQGCSKIIATETRAGLEKAVPGFQRVGVCLEMAA